MLARAEKAAQPVWDVFRVRIKTRSARAIDRAPSSAHREPHSLPTEGEMSKYETERGSSGQNSPFLVQGNWNNDFSEASRKSPSPGSFLTDPSLGGEGFGSDGGLRRQLNPFDLCIGLASKRGSS